jgi:hypothetical protein
VFNASAIRNDARAKPAHDEKRPRMKRGAGHRPERKLVAAASFRT